METDEALVRQVRSGDLTAFDRLYERHETKLFAYLRSLLGDRADAEEVLHDAFLAVLKHRSPAVLEREGAFRAWLYRVGRNLALNRRRAAARYDKNIASAPIADDPPLSVDARGDRVLEARQLEEALAAALHRLPAPLDELWHLRTSGLSYEQIATVVDVPLGTVKSRMHQMVTVLREELKPWILPA